MKPNKKERFFCLAVKGLMKGLTRRSLAMGVALSLVLTPSLPIALAGNSSSQLTNHNTAKVTVVKAYPSPGLRKPPSFPPISEILAGLGQEVVFAGDIKKNSFSLTGKGTGMRSLTFQTRGSTRVKPGEIHVIINVLSETPSSPLPTKNLITVNKDVPRIINLVKGQKVGFLLPSMTFLTKAATERLLYKDMKTAFSAAKDRIAVRHNVDPDKILIVQTWESHGDHDDPNRPIPYTYSFSYGFQDANTKGWNFYSGGVYIETKGRTIYITELNGGPYPLPEFESLEGLAFLLQKQTHPDLTWDNRDLQYQYTTCQGCDLTKRIVSNREIYGELTFGVRKEDQLVIPKGRWYRKKIRGVWQYFIPETITLNRFTS